MDATFKLTRSCFKWLYKKHFSENELEKINLSKNISNEIKKGFY